MSPLLLSNKSAIFRYFIATGFAILVTSVSILIDTRNEALIDSQKTGALIDSIADSIDRKLQAWRLAMSAMSVSSNLDFPYDIESFSKEARKFAEQADINLAFFKSLPDGLNLLAHTKAAAGDLPKFYAKEQIPEIFEAIHSVQQNGTPAVSNLFVGPIAGEYIASLIIPRRTDGKIEDMLSLNFTSRDLSDLLARLKLPKDHIVAIVDRAGIIGARSENPQEFVGKKIPSWYHMILGEQDKGVVDGPPMKGAAFDRYQFVFRHLDEAPGWAVSLLVPPVAFPVIAIRSMSVLLGIASLIVANMIAWILGSTARQKADIEFRYQSLTHRLLDELPGAVVRGIFSADTNQFKVAVAFGKLAQHLVQGDRFQFESALLIEFSKMDLVTDAASFEFDVKENAKIYRVYGAESESQSIGQGEYNLYILDITHQRLAEEAAINSTRLAALGQMAATLAHEMSQPINVISLAADNADSLIRERDLPAAEEKIKKIRDFSGKSRALIDNLLAYARGDQSDKALSPVRLSASVQLAQDLTHAFLSREEIAFSVEMSEDFFVLARPIELENIFVNLIMNSCDAFVQRSIQRPRFIAIRALRHGHDVFISIEDNAGGIPNEILTKIFEPFVTTKNVGHGTGLGLAFVSGHVRAWGGTIAVHNTTQGAQFVLSLPIAS